MKPQIPDLQGFQLIQCGAGLAAAVGEAVEAAGEPGQEVAVLQNILQGQLLQEEPRVAEAEAALVPPVVPAGAVVIVPPGIVGPGIAAAGIGGAAAEGLQVQAAGIAAVGAVVAARAAVMAAGRRDQAGLAALAVTNPVEAIVHKDLPLLFVQLAERRVPHQQPMRGRKRGAKKDGGIIRRPQTVKKDKYPVTVIRRRQTTNRKSASPIGAVNGAMPLRGDFRAFP